jgi:hypothetical protein
MIYLFLKQQFNLLNSKKKKKEQINKILKEMEKKLEIKD